MNKWTVYSHITPSGKMYIGITGTDVIKRWNYGNGYRSCTLFNKAIEKYGWENIQHDVIASNLTEQEAKNFEQLLIRGLELNNPKFGYNITMGGETTNGLRHTDEAKLKVSISNSGENNGRARSVRCITTGEVFGTVTEASKKYHVDRYNLALNCSGRRDHCGTLNGQKLQWEYYKGETK